MYFFSVYPAEKFVMCFLLIHFAASVCTGQCCWKRNTNVKVKTNSVKLSKTIPKSLRHSFYIGADKTTCWLWIQTRACSHCCIVGIMEDIFKKILSCSGSLGRVLKLYHINNFTTNFFTLKSSLMYYKGHNLKIISIL